MRRSLSAHPDAAAQTTSPARTTATETLGVIAHLTKDDAYDAMIRVLARRT
jgi:hypothetical protein